MEGKKEAFEMGKKFLDYCQIYSDAWPLVSGVDDNPICAGPFNHVKYWL